MFSTTGFYIDTNHQIKVSEESYLLERPLAKFQPPEMTIYQSAIQAPPLPRQSLFHYLFPETDSKTESQSNRKIPDDSTALIDALTDTKVTRKEFVNRCQALAGGLRARGLKKGDVVGLMGLNSVEWLVAFHGSHCAGLRVSPINWA
jgi:hypothetical protein